MLEKNTKKVLFFGVQGSGKGTQAENVSEKYDLPYFAPGNILRSEIKNETEIGKTVRSIIDKGQLVSDDVINELIGKKVEESLDTGFVMDGFPRNKVQQDFLSGLVELSHVFLIKISDEEAISRISGRQACNKCGATYHVKFNPPKLEGICDKCSEPLIVRQDDREKSIKERIKIYHKETEPLVDFYKEKGILHEINGEQEIEAVFQDILKVLES